MDKYYSKAALIIKAVFCVCLSLLYMLLSALLNIEDGFLYLICSIFPVVCLYTIPFWISLAYIKKFPVLKVGKYVILDSLCCFLPAILSIVFIDIAYTVAYGVSNSSGMMSVIFIFIYFVITLIYSIFYFVFSYKSKNRS